MQNENRRINEALNAKSKHTYENGVLINKLDIHNQEELDEVETSLCLLRLTNLSMQENRFAFDLMYYLNIHKYIFQDVYPFAGDIRDENITKGNTPFCRPEFIVNYLKYILDEMKKKTFKITSKEEYINFLSYYYSELNMVHPFREGNGRVLREYLRQMVKYLNNFLPLTSYELDYSNISKEVRENLINGSIIGAMTGDLTLLNRFFEVVLKEKNLGEKEKNR